jgi:hypothetical protein
MRRMVRGLVCALALGSGPVAAQGEVFEDLQALAQSLLRDIESLSDYRADGVAAPALLQLPQAQLEAKVCDEPCDVSAAYVPREGIYLAGNLDPLRDVFDRSALLHELVHHLQQGHAKFAALHGCARERAKEAEAYALQNAYLARNGSARRVTFYDGEFACGVAE